MTLAIAGAMGAVTMPGSASAQDFLGVNGTHLDLCRQPNSGFFCLYEAADHNADLKRWRFLAVDVCRNIDMPVAFWDVVSSWTHHQTGNPTVPVISWTRYPDYEPLWTMSGQLESYYVGNQANDKADHYDNTRGC
ncbi:hypothetical protein AB0M43_37295 [Longispora sp. NPDC051575]|uniref:hypothetical protein n=1 Tax=Longispora sp. NPDC051575 TaxID=3154943 RepID=UPI00341BCAA9